MDGWKEGERGQPASNRNRHCFHVKYFLRNKAFNSKAKSQKIFFFLFWRKGTADKGFICNAVRSKFEIREKHAKKRRKLTAGERDRAILA